MTAVSARAMAEYKPCITKRKLSLYMHRFGVGLREAKHIAIKVQLSVDIAAAKDVDELKPMLMYLVRVLHKELTCDILE